MAESLVYWIWVQQAVGAGSSTAAQLLQSFPSAKEIYEADRDALERAGVTGTALNALCRKSLDAAQRQAERCARLGWALTPEDTLYPRPLRNIYSPPLVLYGEGPLPSFDEEDPPVIGMVGTRRCTSYGVTVAGAMAAGLAAVGCPIISGGAVGIDRASHEGTLYAGGHAVLVKPCGLDVEYPVVNRDLRWRVLESGGTIVTEYAPSVRMGNFRVRNRLISGLARGVCVVEAPEISGALITASKAVAQGRDVFVVPGQVTAPESYGSHRLIREGAALVTRPSEILQDYTYRRREEDGAEADRAQAAYYEWKQRSRGDELWGTDNAPAATTAKVTETEVADIPCPNGVSETARRVYEALSAEPLAAELICERTRLTPGEAFAALTELELYGCVDNHSGKRYTRKKG